ncbi:triple tyrosine motif-containing protein [Rheinheimera baltica]|uniref:histidine kinase n=1 Tax=Rheinheimera baltica TaxID=67576 RepID=A0ABT9HZ67_9GAMM|nr:two-component regulator propeller domain-containing protein [Rheinheimera baltica]MDP5136433.1 triple tyrosine motif-containing protein [Rheinheimera baltica]
MIKIKIGTALWCNAFKQYLMVSIVLLLALSPDQADSSSLPETGLFHQVGHASSIPDNVVTSIAQDQQGFVWIGTPSGLLRYDGYQFLLYTHNSNIPDGLPGMFVNDIMQQYNGNLWIATDPGGLAVYDPDSSSFSPIKLSKIENQKYLLENARVMTTDSHQDIWFGGKDGLFRLDKNRQKLTYISDKSTHGILSQVRALMSVKHMVFAGAKEGVFVFNTHTDTLTKLTLKFDNPELLTQILSLAYTDDDSVWIGTANQGLYRLDLSTMQSERIVSSDEILSTQLVNESSINDILQVNDNELWLARFDGIDAINIKSRSWQRKITSDKSSSYSLTHTDIRALMKDNAGQVWTGGYGSGVRLYQGQPAVSLLSSMLSGPFKLPTDNVSSIIELSNGEIWLGSRGEGIQVLHPDKGMLRRINAEPGEPGRLQNGWITTMAELTPGDIWLGVNPGQLYRYSATDDAFNLIDESNQFWSANVRRLFVDSKQRLWIGTNEGIGLWDDKTQSIQRIRTKENGVLTDYINGFVEDSKNTIWVASDANGLLRIEPDTLVANVVRYSDLSPPAHSSVLGLLIDQQQRLWFDTPSGLYRINDTTKPVVELLKIIADEGQLNSDFGANLLEDNQGRIWSQRNIYNPDTNTIYALSPADGVYHGTNWYRSYTKTKAGLMWFGGSEGVLVVQPNKFEKWRYEPKVQLTQATIDDKPVLLSTKNMIIPAKAKGFSVEFSGLDLSSPLSVKYRHKLNGFDTEWRYSDASHRKVNYTNLWPGNYRLLVQSTNRAGQWSPNTLELTITVLPAFWQTHWFILLALIAVVLAIFSIVKLRTHRLKRQAKQLEQEVASRTQELKAVQKSLSEKEKMAALGHMVAGIAHEINTPLGISVTASSLLQETTNQLQLQFEHKSLTSAQLQQFLQQSQENLALLMSNLYRSADLVQSFKEVAIDATMEVVESVNVYQWLQQRIQLLGPRIQPHQVEIICPSNLNLQLPAKALEVVLMHLLNNSLIHGFSKNTPGKICISFEYKAQQCTLLYQDNGSGVAVDVTETLFDPFVTTKRGAQCKGLGLHLCYNLVTQVMAGQISLLQSNGNGAQFHVTFPAQSGNKS